MMTDPWDFAVFVLEDADCDLERAHERVDAMLKNPQCRKQLNEICHALIMHALERFWKELLNPLGAMNDTIRDLREGVDAQLRAMEVEVTETEPKTPAAGLSRPGASDAARGNVLVWPSTSRQPAPADRVHIPRPLRRTGRPRVKPSASTGPGPKRKGAGPPSAMPDPLRR